MQYLRISAMIMKDMGFVNALDTFNTVLRTLDQAQFVIHIGDISYADNYFLRPEMTTVNTYEQTWDIWQQWVQPITSHKACIITFQQTTT